MNKPTNAKNVIKLYFSTIVKAKGYDETEAVQKLIDEKKVTIYIPLTGKHNIIDLHSKTQQFLLNSRKRNFRQPGRR